ncbi:MAG: MoaD/ThiS family protein [Anaerolineae bacterium]|nr:MoaD/ThiS family protein [Anaerolineae bacterium]
MAVQVELFGQLAAGAPRTRTLVLDQPMTVQEIAQHLGLAPEQIGLIVINGVQCEMDEVVPADCRLCFFPPVSGG